LLLLFAFALASAPQLAFDFWSFGFADLLFKKSLSLVFSQDCFLRLAVWCLHIHPSPRSLAHLCFLLHVVGLLGF
jgi:hypothetical protein